jgi:hypothetical protein
MTTEIPEEWYFICAPQQVSWSKDSRTTTIEPYGTNNPYVHYGTTKLRSLTLNDSMVEGFSDGKVVEENIINLEACMRMVLDSEDGFASPYVWDVYAGGKTYGKYIINSVNVTEEIRDLQGLAARAKVDISLQEVSPYQVSSGIDITAEALSGEFNDKVNEYNDKKAEESQKDKQQDKNVNDQNSQNGKGNDSTTGGGDQSGDTTPDPSRPGNNPNDPSNAFKPTPSP